MAVRVLHSYTSGSYTGYLQIESEQVVSIYWSTSAQPTDTSRAFRSMEAGADESRDAFVHGLISTRRGHDGHDHQGHDEDRRARTTNRRPKEAA